MEAPRNLSRSSIISWVIGVLSAVTVTVFGFWKSSMDDLLERETKRADRAEDDNDKLRAELSKCQNEKNLYEVIHRFGVAPGRKTVEVTPDQQNTDDYEN